MNVEHLYFKDIAHQEAFLEMLEDMYLSEKEIKTPSLLLKKQLAFAYLVALYQKDYEEYEGEKFYIECGEELSIGGPIYLMDKRYGRRTKLYEKMVWIACQFLKKEISNQDIINLWEQLGENYIEDILKQAFKIIE
ncbi:MAG: hypothetical protein E7231_13965 [Cellulosilyticum sp.]|nr:hypothetical protein [Cellulosilyticum sp.]